MLAPIDKLARHGNDIIQVVITTACDRNCSNCTQLLPFRKDYRFMSPECFAQAIGSLREWPGIVALFGGNPCVHPMFGEFCRMLADTIAPEHRGLWTNNVFKHGAIAAETFSQGRLNLNAHGDAEAYAEMNRWFPGKVITGSDTQHSMHAGILVDRHDLGMTDGEWVSRRERCDINQKWSGAVVQRDGKPYAYFCEVAAALDGVRHENHGVPALNGWWRNTMAEFGDQVRQCCDRGCAVPLRLVGHRDDAETYDVSAAMLPLTLQPRVPTTIAPVATFGEQTRAADDYMRRF